MPCDGSGMVSYWEGGSLSGEFCAGCVNCEGERMADQQPSVGRTVHYVAYGTPGGEFPSGVCRAAIITEIDTHSMIGHEFSPGEIPAVGVCVLNPSGLFFNRHIPYDEAKKPGSWHWPERV